MAPWIAHHHSRQSYEPRAMLALDTNEDSMDGIFVSSGYQTLVRQSFHGVARIQRVYADRRARLARRKARDRRVSRRLLHREGARERARVRQRLHLISKRLVTIARQRQGAIALEDCK